MTSGRTFRAFRVGAGGRSGAGVPCGGDLAPSGVGGRAAPLVLAGFLQPPRLKPGPGRLRGHILLRNVREGGLDHQTALA